MIQRRASSCVLFNKYYLDDEINEHERGEAHLTRMGKMRNVYKTFVGEHESSKLFGKHNRGWEDNIKTDVKERGRENEVTLNWLRAEVLNTVRILCSIKGGELLSC
jgi:hypothetical protein